MSGRGAILSRIRSALGTPERDAERRDAVAARLARPSRGVIPARGQLDPARRTALFSQMAEAVSATVERVKSHEMVPKAVATYLRGRNLAAAVRMGDDRRLARMPWATQRSIEIRKGPSDGNDEVGVSHAFAGIAETGTLVLVSGRENPTTVNFLPDHHIVVVEAREIEGDIETVLARIRKKFGRGEMPRTVNMITGPSRSGDIEQKLLLGAHGPRALHIIVVG